MSPRFQKSQKVINSMNYPCRVFIGKSTHSVWVTVFIAFACFVIFNGPVEAFSLPEGKLFAYQGESNHPGSFEIGTGGTISHTQEIVTHGIDQAVELMSSVTTDSKPVANKEADETPYKTKDWFIDYLLKKFPHADPFAVEVLIRIAYPIAGYIIGYLLVKLWRILH